jgi:hypothetical protein
MKTYVQPLHSELVAQLVDSGVPSLSAQAAELDVERGVVLVSIGC